MQNNLIHKIQITSGAKFDYEECMELGILPKTEIKNSVEEYLYLRQLNGEIFKHYFKVKFFDEATNKMLILFIKKSAEFLSMLIWRITGICAEEDYVEELEYLGINRNWYNSPIELSEIDKTDFVKAINNIGGGVPDVKINGLNREEIYGIGVERVLYDNDEYDVLSYTGAKRCRRR